MAQTYRDVAINQMIATTEQAMSHAVDWWGDLPTSMKEAIDKFRVSTWSSNRFRRICKKGARQAGTRNIMEGH